MSQVARLLTFVFITSMLLTMSGCCNVSGTQLLTALGVYDTSTNTWTGNDITLSTLFGDFFDTTTGVIATIALAATIYVGAIRGGSPQGFLLVPAIIAIAVFVNDMVGLANYVTTPFLKAIIGMFAVTFSIYYIFSLVRFWQGND